ncbi:type II toxin-antitoxin system HicA family toxin [Cephaloticoccus primus]|uniref:type II toxin-antitoxin system HicA family toxin n=1 Tax=Cephaloticoccus primus TaxID=1548207 RepID=UPI0012E84376|nr:type II toxin-antitoxin system HicA family toxin [Cephaloticoccus primus]
MANWKKVLERVRSQQGEHDAGIRLEEFCILLPHLGYSAKRQRGSHRVYDKEGWPPMVVVSGRDGKVKAYLVRKLREELEKHGYRS